MAKNTYKQDEVLEEPFDITSAVTFKSSFRSELQFATGGIVVKSRGSLQDTF